MSIPSISRTTRILITDKCSRCTGQGVIAGDNGAAVPCYDCGGTGRASISVGELLDYIDEELGRRLSDPDRM